MGDNWGSNDAGGWYSGGGWSGNVGYEMPDDDDASQHGAANFLGSGGGRSGAPPPNVSTVGYRGFGIAAPSSRPVFDESYGKLSAQEMDGGGGIDGDERPLLEELGINFDHIYQNTLSVLNPFRNAHVSVLSDNDLAGPLVFCMIFGASLLLHGKMHFGYIYGIGVLGCLGMYALLNLMAENGLSLTCAVSVLGYCLLPMSLLSLIAAVFSFKGAAGLAISIAAVLWCSLSASKLFVTALTMDKQRFLVAYPCSLFYGVFALMAIF